MSSIEKQLKILIISLIKKLLRPRDNENSIKDYAAVKNIIVVRQDNRIGNLVMLTPLFSSIKQVFPNSRLTVLVGGEYPDILENNSNIAKIIVFNQKKVLKNPFLLRNILSEITKSKYDICIDASHPHSFSLTDALLAYYTKARTIIGFRRGESNFFYNIEVIPDLNKHNIETELDLIKFFDNTLESPNSNIQLSDHEINIPYKLGLDRSRNYIGMFLGARGNKKWPIENFIEITQKLQKNNKLEVLWFLGPDEENLYNSLLRVAEYQNTLDKIRILRQLPIRTIASYIKSCKLFISGDTGPMHIAIALGVPTIQLFIDNGSVDRFGYTESQNGFPIIIKNNSVSVNQVLETAYKVLNDR